MSSHTETPKDIPHDNETIWTDNGFSNAEVMNTCHQVILDAPMPHAGPIVDLGCGDGRLLYRLGTRYPGRRLYGVEIDKMKIERGKERHVGVEFYWGNIYSLPIPEAGTVIMNPRRLVEIGSDWAKSFLRRLKPLTQGMVVYTYNPVHRGITELFRDSYMFLDWGVWWTYKYEGVEAAVLYKSNENPPT